MITGLRDKLSYSNVVATLALFAALGGTAAAVTIPRHSVGPKQLKRGAVTSKALRKGAVKSRKLAPRSVIGGKLGAAAVGPGNIGNGAVTASKLAKSSVTNPAIRNGVVGTNKLGNGAVTTVKLANGAVTLAKLGDEVAPLLGTLRSGQTLRGVFNVGGTSAVGEETAHEGVSYQFPLNSAATVTILQPGATTANCPGISGGGGQTPQATGGNLCLYLTTATNLDATTPLAVENNTRLGFGVAAKAAGAGEYLASGQWAVTAP